MFLQSIIGRGGGWREKKAGGTNKIIKNFHTAPCQAGFEFVKRNIITVKVDVRTGKGDSTCRP